MSAYKIGYFVGSLSSTSINRVLSEALIKLAPEDLEFTEIPIGDLPLYSPDFDSDYPAAARALKDSIAASTRSCSSLLSTTARSPARSRTRSTGRRDPGGRTPSTTCRPA